MTILTDIKVSAKVGQVAKVAQGSIQEAAKNSVELTAPARIDVSNFLDLKSANIKQVDKFILPNFERKEENFIKTEPEIIFVAEYKVNDVMIGSLLVWETFFDATHYEIFKRNVFDPSSSFERVLFLDKASLEEEKDRLFPYISDTLGFSELEKSKIMMFMDHRTKEDRIYEYAIRASRVPQAVTEVDFDLALKSKDLLTEVQLIDTSLSTLKEFAGSILGSEGLSWSLALINNDISFFGRTVLEKPLTELLAQKTRPIDGNYTILVPKNLNSLVSIINESVSLFDAKDTFAHIVDVLGGLSEVFGCSFVDAIDSVRGVFSYDKFKQTIVEQLPVFDLLLKLSESRSLIDVVSLSSLNITLPQNKGSDSIHEIEGISKVFEFLNSAIIATLYSQDPVIFDKLKSIIAGIEKEKLKKDPEELAVEETREEESKTVNETVSVSISTDNSAAESKSTSSLYSVTSGGTLAKSNQATKTFTGLQKL